MYPSFISLETALRAGFGALQMKSSGVEQETSGTKYVWASHFAVVAYDDATNSDLWWCSISDTGIHFRCCLDRGGYYSGYKEKSVVKCLLNMTYLPFFTGDFEGDRRQGPCFWSPKVDACHGCRYPSRNGRIEIVRSPFRYSYFRVQYTSEKLSKNNVLELVDGTARVGRTLVKLLKIC